MLSLGNNICSASQGAAQVTSNVKASKKFYFLLSCMEHMMPILSVELEVEGLISAVAAFDGDKMWKGSCAQI